MRKCEKQCENIFHDRDVRKCEKMYIECLKEDDDETINIADYEEFCKYMKNKKKLTE